MTDEEADERADDPQWFELMAGRDAADASAATRTEAAWLRAALLAFAPAPPAGAMPEAAQRAQSLIERARRAGVLQEREAPRWPWLRRPLLAGSLGLALAGVLAVVVLRGVVPDAPTADTERGAALQQLVVADPAARRQALLQSLRAAGLDAQPYERLGRLGIDIALPVPLAAAQQQVLRAAGLQPPGGPALRVELIDGASRP